MCADRELAFILSVGEINSTILGVFNESIAIGFRSPHEAIS